MVYTIFTLALVGFILIFWFYQIVVHFFYKPLVERKYQKKESFFSRQATILSVHTIKHDKYPLMELLIKFKNLSGYPIQKKVLFRDRKPHPKRFGPNEKLQIILDERKKKKIILLVDNGKKISLLKVLFRSFGVLGYILGCYFLVDKTFSILSKSPKKYEALFANSRLEELGLAFLIVSIFLYFLLTKNPVLANRNNKDWDLLYCGLGATAVIKEYSDTGTLLNHNPIVEFQYKFKDQSGKIYGGCDRKSVGKLEIGKIDDLESLDIMYLPQNPSISKIVGNIEPSETSWFVRAIYLFIVFVFSVNVIVIFYNVALSQ